jgi:hypothetical protein
MKQNIWIWKWPTETRATLAASYGGGLDGEGALEIIRDGAV